MPRQARIDAPGALHHVIIRGIEHKAIFKDAKDYRNFLDRLGLILTETETPCFAWALIPNHFHLLLRTGNVPISTVMRRLLPVITTVAIVVTVICFTIVSNPYYVRRTFTLRSSRLANLPPSHHN